MKDEFRREPEERIAWYTNAILNDKWCQGK